ncbi:MAG: hypothetical protein WBA98_05320 [Gordonia sp. (in: high G+C Gram-positive bacteria)]|uniref:hypothetical protein n=1 Tax=Gordonia sp. (in: high G+C Gram-positive bacteria) TaxID=84139 RepID=UPI003C710261
MASRGGDPAKILALAVAGLSLLTVILGLFHNGFFLLWGVAIVMLALISVMTDKVDTKTIAAIVSALAVGTAVGKVYNVIYSAVKSDELLPGQNSTWDYVYLALNVVLAVVAALWLLAEFRRPEVASESVPTSFGVDSAAVNVAPTAMPATPVVAPATDSMSQSYGQAHGTGQCHGQSYGQSAARVGCGTHRRHTPHDRHAQHDRHAHVGRR